MAGFTAAMQPGIFVRMRPHLFREVPGVWEIINIVITCFVCGFMGYSHGQGIAFFPLCPFIILHPLVMNAGTSMGIVFML